MFTPSASINWLRYCSWTAPFRRTTDSWCKERLRLLPFSCVVMCSVHDPVRTCTLGAFHIYWIIILAFLLRGNNFKIMESGISWVVYRYQQGDITWAGCIEVKGAIWVLGHQVQPPDDKGVFLLVLFDSYYDVRHVLKAGVVVGSFLGVHFRW